MQCHLQFTLALTQRTLNYHFPPQRSRVTVVLVVRYDVPSTPIHCWCPFSHPFSTISSASCLHFIHWFTMFIIIEVQSLGIPRSVGQSLCGLPIRRVQKCCKIRGKHFFVYWKVQQKNPLQTICWQPTEEQENTRATHTKRRLYMTEPLALLALLSGTSWLAAGLLTGSLCHYLLLCIVLLSHSTLWLLDWGWWLRHKQLRWLWWWCLSAHDRTLSVVTVLCIVEMRVWYDAEVLNLLLRVSMHTLYLIYLFYGDGFSSEFECRSEGNRVSTCLTEHAIISSRGFFHLCDE